MGTMYASATEGTTVWTLQKTVDDFGDVTPDSVTVIGANFDGTFSNTATNSSDLRGTIYFEQKTNSDHYIVGFTLLEYGNKNATYLISDEKTLKIKIDDTIYEFPIYGTSPNGVLAVGVDDYDYGADFILGMLYIGKDLRCIINIGSSQYRFNIKSSNLPQLMVNAEIDVPPADMTAKEALNIYLTDNSKGFKPAYAFFSLHRDDYPILTVNEMEQEIQGTFFEAQVDTLYPYWDIRKYEDGRYETLAFLRDSYGSREFKKAVYYGSSGDPTTPYSFKDNLIIMNGKDIYQVRKLADGIYLRYKPEKNDNRSPIILCFPTMI